MYKGRGRKKGKMGCWLTAADSVSHCPPSPVAERGPRMEFYLRSYEILQPLWQWSDQAEWGSAQVRRLLTKEHMQQAGGG